MTTQSERGIVPEVTTPKEELEKAIKVISDISQEKGLDPFDTHFHLVPSTIMYEIGAYGLPGRYSHWTHGRSYGKMKTMYDYGLSRIYELVINTNPSDAFLMENNDLLQNKLVVAHVLGHTDFFKHNVHFKGTNRQMVETVSIHADRLRKYEFEHGRIGEESVEDFLDCVLTIEDNIDERRMPGESADEFLKRTREEYLQRYKAPKRQPTPYDDLLLLGEEKPVEKKGEVKVPFPAEEVTDLLWFIANFSPKGLEGWQQDIIDIVRGETLYFRPQMRTKILNEGWASYWHREIFRTLGERGLLKPGEDIAWPLMHAGVVASHRGQLNPYGLGLAILDDIDRRYNGQVPDDAIKDRDWKGQEIDPAMYIGRPDYDIFWVRKNMDDAGLIRNYLSAQVIHGLDLYIYKREGEQYVVVEKNPVKIRDMLVAALSNHGMPIIAVGQGGGDYNGNKELYLSHKYEGQELDIKYAQRTLEAVYKLWGRAVHLETISDDKKLLLGFDGEKHTQAYL